MKNDLRDALGPGPNCPPLEQLARLLSANPPAELANHAAACPHCQTEVHLLKTFEAAEVEPSDAAAIHQVTQRLRQRSSEIFPAPPARVPWWQGLFATPWLRPAAFAFAAVLVAAGVGLQIRSGGAPALHPPGDSAQQELRSREVTVLAPLGDVERVPTEVRWQAVPGAVKYTVRLLEVDRSELWAGETLQPRIDLPATVQSRIVPAKSILCQVRALDAAGRTVADSDTLRFRLLQNIYPR